MQKIIAETGDFPLSTAIYPNLKDAEKVVADAMFMENPSDEQFKKLKDDFRKIFLEECSAFSCKIGLRNLRSIELLAIFLCPLADFKVFALQGKLGFFPVAIGPVP